MRTVSFKVILRFVAVLMFGFFSEELQAQNQPITIEIPMKKAETKKEYIINKNEQQHFLFNLKKGLLYTISVEQKGIDLTIALKDSLGKTIKEQDSPNGAFGPEIIEYTANSTQKFTLDIIPFKDGKISKGKFKIDIRVKTIIDNKVPIVTICTPKQMQEDLKVFRAIRQQANSGFYKYRTTKQLDSIYNWAFSQIKTPQNILSFYKIVLKLTDFEGSLHNNTTLPYPLKDYFPKNEGYFPLSMKLIEDKMIVNTTNSEIPIGSQILSINGVSDASLKIAFYKYYTTDGYNTSQKNLLTVENSFGVRYMNEFGIYKSFIIEYQLPNSNEVFQKILLSISLEGKQKQVLHSANFDNFFDENKLGKYGFKQLDANTGLLSIRSFAMGGDPNSLKHKKYVSFLDSIFQKIKTEKNIKHLIIDVRNNGGGSGLDLTKTFTYLANQPFKENKSAFISFNKLPLPENYVYNSTDKENQKKEKEYAENELKKDYSIAKNGKFYQNEAANPTILPNPNAFTGKLYVLINPNVASAASNFASLVKGNTDAVFIGEETTGGYYGHNGHRPIIYQLPNTKIKTQFSIVNLDQYVPEKATQPFGRGVLPDYEVKQSFDDFMNNRDKQMEFVLKLIDAKN